MATVREKRGRWEVLFRNKKLLGDRVVSITRPTHEEAIKYANHYEAMLKNGILPEEFRDGGDRFLILGEVIKKYIEVSPVADGDVRKLQTLYDEIGSTALKDICYPWLEQWISKMKRVDNLSPSTVRHKVGAIGRCLAWGGRTGIGELAINPVKMLPRGYATYNDHDKAALKLEGKIAPDGDHRDRRLNAGEEDSIRQVLATMCSKDGDSRIRYEHQAAFELMFELAIESAMRMREMYTLTRDQISLDESTIFLEKTKNGQKRQVPITTPAARAIKVYYELVERGERGMDGFMMPGERIFPWWDGDTDRNNMHNTTSMLSQKFAKVFEMAGAPDLHFHDLRHEATSRLFERTTLRESEIMEVTGHTDIKSLNRYRNLRASRLAGKLW